MILTEKIMDSSKKSIDLFLAKKSKRNIITHYKKLKSKMEKSKEYEHFPVSLYSGLIVYAFEKDPRYFMREIYTDLRYFLVRSFDKQSLKNIEMHVIKNSSFQKNEKLVFQLEGKFMNKIHKSGSRIIFNNSNIYLTNKRIIIQSNDMEIGVLDTELISYGSNSFLLDYYKNMIFNRSNRQMKQKPCYGYDFPIYNIQDVKSDHARVCYSYSDTGKNNKCEPKSSDRPTYMPCKYHRIPKTIT
ncbi:MAG: hypothetical protein ACFE8P_04790 [Promethearchaeota archaeon]